MRSKRIFGEMKASINSTDENEMEFRYLVQVNNTCEWIWSNYFKYITFSVVVVETTSIISVLHAYWTEEHVIFEDLYRPANIVYAIENIRKVFIK